MTAREIYDYLIAKGLTPEGACGLMGNLQAESGLRANNAQNNMTSMTDEQYTAAVDSGAYTRFVNDSIGYGLAQWTYWSRKKGLLELARSRGVSVGDARMQLDYCLGEIKSRYPTLLALLTSTNDLLKATRQVCIEYERPAVNNIDTRYKYAQELYKMSIQPPDKENDTMTENEAIAKLLAVAEAEVGYLEKRTNDQLDDKTANAGANNWNKYARDIDTKYPNFYNGRKNGFHWCDIFVDWCFITAFGYDNALKMLYAPEKSTGAGCSFSADFFRKNGQFHKNPKVGDQVFFGDYGNEGHTGIVVAVEGSVITTIEGNTSGGSGVVANGGGVFRKTYNTDALYIPGYGRPDWAVVTGGSGGTVEPDKPTVGYPLIRRGSKGAAVKKAQQLLISKGYDCGTAGADGDFGYGTYKAVLAFQADNGLETDGIIGADTWAMLLREDEPTAPETKPEQEDDPKPQPSPQYSKPSHWYSVKLPLLCRGMTHPAVAAAQMLLAVHGYFDGEPDVSFDEQTKRAVMGFQADHGLDTDGEIGGATWAALIG